ncbi:unnamed protein product [Brachionus calyciflorus]|uniref:WD repeat-containing protein 44 n=1 Tax=Brachionus calyciflorus TaxID=104777 RepID=A0A814NKW8_9BILA|nr:unnamed protein product [Brachionus calyciflorus]
MEEEYYDAESSPLVSDFSLNSFDSNEFNFEEYRVNLDEKFKQIESELNYLPVSNSSDFVDTLENHLNLIKFREQIDTEETEKSRNISTNSTQGEDYEKSLQTESENELKSKTWPKGKTELNEFINPVDKQILYHISKIKSSGSEYSDEEFDSLKDESLLDNDDIFESFEADEDDVESKSFSHENFINRKSFDTTSMNISSSSKFKNEKKKNRLRRAITKFGRAVVKSSKKNSSDSADSDTDQIPNLNESSETIKYKSSHSSQSSNEFDKTQIIQILTNSESSQKSPQSIIWSMKFSPCGKLLATAGKDKKLTIWILKSSVEYFLDQIRKNNNNELPSLFSQFQKIVSIQEPFVSKPFIQFEGHTQDILDLSWSKNLFVLTASSDKTCRLWHVYKQDCLCIFNHQSIISSISFHPKDDRYFISACLDSKLRLWNIADKVVVLSNDLNSLNRSDSNFITAINFCQGGKLIAVGTFDGKCILYHTEHLKYYSLINVRSTRGRNSKGSKVTGIECLNNDENKILITSNDSRIRLYDLRDLSLVCKYKGFANSTVHIKASLSPDDKFIISGSKNKCCYIWKTNHQFSMLTSGRRDRNNHWERIQAHNAIVTCAVFAPKPSLFLYDNNEQKISKNLHVFASAAGCDGVIKIFLNK